ncbi:spermine synthase [Puniceicoccales bacterium CK1056]|uniref:Spermine synthase n=1 Tax=Oceanipulchritudo coccoides TaxID=2706888 RepID=A0A6B2M5P6_9BACT|nr:spermine synthase [Oceanipulchritudo coccoides]NDV63479.1 spermine synthase [Oceanipulchritudo coccoides]
MKPRIKLAAATTPDGGTLALYEHDGAWSMSLNGQELMHSRATASETLMGELGVEHLDKDGAPRILIGGLGLGFTLQSVLRSVSSKAIIEVVELFPDVVSWNREFLKDLNGSLLEDPRVEVRTEDVGGVIRSANPGTYDVILLDVDNGPVAMVVKANASLYSPSGTHSIRRALKRKGRAVLWSASQDKAFEERLTRQEFSVQAVPAKVHAGAKRPAYTLYIADRA